MIPDLASRHSGAGRVTVRVAQLVDRMPVQRIAAAAMREFGVEPDFDHLDRELGNFGDGHGATFTQLVAVWEGRVVGSLILSWKDARTLKLSAFYVDATLRGKGAGRLLLDEAISRACGCGAARIYLETWSIMKAAIHLYTAYGWRRGERLAPETGAEWSYLFDLTQPPC